MPYIRKNLAFAADRYADRDVILVEAAVGERSSVVDFYEENLTGQNNSVVEDFEGLKQNQKNSYVDSTTNKRKVNLVALDEYFLKQTIDFIKIDIEGYEWFALRGAIKLISRDLPGLMVEVQASHNEIFHFFKNEDYLLFNEDLDVAKQPSDLRSNTFCLHRIKHAKLISSLGINLEDDKN